MFSQVCRDDQATALIVAPFGGLRIIAGAERLVGMEFDFEVSADYVPPNPVLEAVAYQLTEYFADSKARFSLPLRQGAPEYTRRVWQALTQIPPGRTETYGTLAKQVGGSPRAIAGACRANPFPIIVPCHRVVSANGPGGYCGQLSGPMLDIKRWLLRHEGYPLD